MHNTTPCHWKRVYVTHKPEDHDEIMARRYGDKKSTTATQTGGAGGRSSNGNSLSVSQKLKEVLCSKLMLSDADADNVCKDVCGRGKD